MKKIVYGTTEDRKWVNQQQHRFRAHNRDGWICVCAQKYTM